MGKVLYPTDAQNYVGGDSGCRWASRKLGKPSKCQECQFDECKMDRVDRIASRLQHENLCQVIALDAPEYQKE